MKLNLKIAWLKKLQSEGGTPVVKEFSWRNDDQWAEIEIELFTDNDRKCLLKQAQESSEKGSRSVVQKINMYDKLKTDLTGTKLSRLEPLAEALRQFIMPSPHKWVFEEIGDGQVVPWYVRSIRYCPPDDRNGSPACVNMDMHACRCGAKADRSTVWHTVDLGVDVVTALKSKGFYLETAEAVKTYESQMEHYRLIQGLTGEQFWASGSAFQKSRWGHFYGNDLLAMERDGEPARVVMDDQIDDEGSVRSAQHIAVSSSFWLDKKQALEAMDREDKVATIPVQPYVNVFDLVRHIFIIIHTVNLKAYDYDANLIDKLILSAERKDLISILVAGADMQLEDIVKGKTGGIVVICTGPPGTGKTLTAEVFSEQIKHPLYCVQCSQLGTNETELEKQLQIVLGRAARWKAILLIDEADVYVHERGTDLQQNAIVGVFLRVLEHYRGVMFMTSNRDTIVDDAILSRATAWIRYEYPNEEQLPLIWQVLAVNYEVALTAKDIAELCKQFPKISGRTVKSLLRLGRLLTARKGGKVDVKLLQYVSQFIDLDAKAKQRQSLSPGLVRVS